MRSLFNASLAGMVFNRAGYGGGYRGQLAMCMRSIGSAVIFAALLVFGLTLSSEASAAGSPSAGNTLFNNASYCIQCHISPPETARLLAANNRSVIENAIAQNYGGGVPGGTDGMGQFSGAGARPLSTTQLDDIAAYIGLYVVPTTSGRSASVAYNSGANAISLTANITVGTPASINITGPTNGGVTSSVSTVGGSVVTIVNYTPNASYYGADSFTYTVTNSAGTSASATVNITVNNPPAPTAGSPFPNVAYGSSNNAIDLTSSISGVVDGAGVTVTVNPTNGTINSVVGNVVTYTPNPTYSGNDTFSYTVAGPGGTSNTGVVTISVGAPPAPIANAASRNVAYNSASNALDLTAAITNPSTSVAVTVAPTQGIINSVSGNVVTYTPTPGYYGTDTFSYTATGPGGGPSAAAVVTVTVGNPPAPTAAARNANVPFNTATGIDLSASISGVSSSIAIASAAGHGSTSIAGNVVTYTPTAGYSGADTFTYTATGPGGTSAAATVSITVGTLAPTATATTMSVPLNTATTINLTSLVAGSSITGVSIAAQPAHGAVSVNGMVVTYTPTHNYFGADTFSYVAYGNAGTSPAAAVTVTIVGRPNPTADVATLGVLNAQVDSARRFTRAQISNFQGRMESLHRVSRSNDSDTNPNASFNENRGSQISAIRAAANGSSFSSTGNRAAPGMGRPTGAAYQPAASLAANSHATLPPAGMVGAAGSGDVLLTIASALAASTDGASSSDPVTAVAKALKLATTAAQTASLNLSASTGNSDGASSLPGGVDYWIGGGVKFGNRNATSSSSASSFTSDGISMGLDRRFGDQLALGVGVGFGRDVTDIGTDGTHSKSRSTTLAVYGSYQPIDNVYLDGTVGYGVLNYHTDRFVTAANDFARAQRSGSSLFGSLTAGYEYRMPGLHLSPYGRLDVAQNRLDETTESGAGIFALRYASQTLSSVQFSLGLRAESAHETSFGWALPRIRVEYQRDFKGDQPTSVSYADLPGGTSYLLAAPSTNRNSYVLGLGSDFIMRQGLTLSVDYQYQRSPGNETSQGIFVKMVKSLDGRAPAAGLLAPAAYSLRGKGLRIDAGYMVDDNVTRSSTALDKLSDSAFSVTLSRNINRPAGEHSRFVLNGFAGAEKFRTYTGLGRLYAGGEVEFQYRPSGDFGSPIWGVFANVTLEDYESNLRDGYRYSTGLSVRKPLTDRIHLFGALAKHGRYGKSAVFDTNDYSARLNLDYALTAASTLYIAGEYRYGDIVSSGQPSLDNIDIAKVFVRDDVFTRPQLFDYRFDARTVLFTLGYNWPFGPKDSLDFSWRRAQSTPTVRPGYVGASTPRYVANQFSIIYLLSF